MFERYTERARRVIFVARYEARVLGSQHIEPEHLLLGILREDKELGKRFLTSHVIESIREQIEQHTTAPKRVSTSVNLPMSSKSKRVLKFAAEEAAEPCEITPVQLLLAILRMENCLATEILHQHGLSLAAVRQELQGAMPEGTVKHAHSKPPACQSCRHLHIDGRVDVLSMFCAASPRKPAFDCYSGEFKLEPEDPLWRRLEHCMTVNFGECKLFEPKEN